MSYFFYIQEFWDWSWQDLAMYDLAEMVQYMYSLANSKIFLVGHSQVIVLLELNKGSGPLLRISKLNFFSFFRQGTIMSFAALTQPRVAEMVEAAALLCPISYLDHVTAPLVERMVFMHLDQVFLALEYHRNRFQKLKNLSKKKTFVGSLSRWSLLLACIK